ncbi:MAG: DUF3500 domain-containing protein, partial [Woeseiaceae bacterium]
MKQYASLIVASTLVVWLCSPVSAQQSGVDDRARRMSEEAEARGLADPYAGIHTEKGLIGGLYALRSTGVTTEPVRKAATDLLAVISSEQRGKALFAVDDAEWRKWMNQSFYVRQGVGFDEMDEEQRAAAFTLLRSSLSARGLKLSRDIMKLNRTLGELNDNDFKRFNEWLYWITVMGEPSSTEPWGWQLDGHHLIINYFVLGDQVVMTPLFVGSEPVRAEAGKYAGTVILQDEQDRGLAMLRSLDERQRKAAILEITKDGNNNLGEAFKDNFVLNYAGVSVSAFSDEQKTQLEELIQLYIGIMDDGHARVKMDQVLAHFEDTYFAWIGGLNDDSVYYYRIHSPVILIEFDHQRPANLRHLYPPVPNREHIHAVVRTPNGND